MALPPDVSVEVELLVPAFGSSKASRVRVGGREMAISIESLDGSATAGPLVGQDATITDYVVDEVRTRLSIASRRGGGLDVGLRDRVLRVACEASTDALHRGYARASEAAMASWVEFAVSVPEMAAAGRRRLVGDDGVAIAFLASAGVKGRPHLAPVCPIVTESALYLSAGAATPKVRDLRENPAYVLHAFLGENDEEFQVAGNALEIADPTERAQVHDAIPFAAFEREDPIFRLDLTRALWVYWERVGQPDTRAVRRRWRESG
jgi:hypothetical protein